MRPPSPSTLSIALGSLRKRIMGGYDGFVFSGMTLISLRLREPALPVKQAAGLYLLKEDKSATRVTAAPRNRKG